MAIQPIALNDLDARAKINAAIAQANLVAGKAEATEIAQRALYSEVGPMRERPGEPGRFFSATLDGAPSNLPPIADGIKLLTADGLVARLPGGATIATIAAFRIEPGHRYRARFVFRRSQDSEDPAGDAVRLGLRWLCNDKTGLTTAVLADLLDLRVANGRLEYSFAFATVEADDIDAAAPAGAVYVRPFVRTFSFGITDVEAIELTDLTLAAAYTPDLSAYRNEIAGLQQQLSEALDRITALEGA